MQVQTASLAINNLSVKYRNQFGCENINFSAVPGERIAVIGPNGAGKSSLFKAIVGLHPVFSGNISIHNGPHLKGISQISYVPQHESVDWNFPASVWDTVMMVRAKHIGFFLPPRSADRKAVKSALEKVDLWELRNRQIGQLSGGQRRRVFIARALAQEATIVLMDEPFVGVDATVEQEIFDVLDMLREQEITVLVATHNLEQASTHYDKILMINRQQIAYGCPEDVFIPDNLSRTFGGQLTMWRDNEQYVMVADDPCHDHQH